jgi:Uma2 family endonuclease
LSPSTEDFDRAEKLPIYAREGVAHAWLLDPDVKTLEVFRLDGETYRLIYTWRGDAVVRAEPFDAIELELAALWAR